MTAINTAKEEKMNTETKPQHTPTPWIQRKGFTLPGGHDYWTAESLDGKNTAFQTTKEANAAYIVRAVNCHEELLETLKEVGRWSPTLPALIEKRINEAIAQAESK